MSEPIITVKKDGKVIYEGPDRHKDFGGGEKKLFGLKISEWASIVMPLLFLGMMYAKMEATWKACDYLMKFSQNSDNWHGVYTGVQFEQGRPMSPVDHRSVRPGGANG